MTTYTVTANLQTIALMEADDAVNIGNFNNIAVYSSQSGALSDEVINLGAGTGVLVDAYSGDTILGGTGTATLKSVGHGNTYDLGDGTFSAKLASQDTYSAGNGTSTISMGPSVSDILINLGDGHNTLISNGVDYLTFIAGDGNNLFETYPFAGGLTHNTFELGSGNNQLDLSNYDVVTAGLGSTAESDQIAIRGFNNTIVVGDGNNWIGTDTGQFYAGERISVGNGNNEVILGSSSTLTAGNGNNIVGGIADPVSDQIITLGNGNNTVNMFASSTLTAGNGDNSVALWNASDDLISLGGGNDSIVNLGSFSTVVGGDGNDQVSAYEFAGIGPSVLLGQHVTLGNGDDTVSVYSDSTVYVGNGNDTFTLRSYDTLVAGNGSDVIWANQISNALISVGDGNDSVTIIGSDSTGGNNTLIAGNGSHFVTISPQALGGASITFGNGNDTIIGSRESGDYVINTGAGDDLFSFENQSGGNLYINQPISGSQAAGFDLLGSTFDTVSLTVQNADDVIALGDAVIPHLTINVAVDGFKLPDGYDLFATSNLTSPTAAVVNYLDTGEVINAAYAQAVPLPYFIDRLVNAPLPHWNDKLGQALTLDFSFMQSLPSYASGIDGDDFTALGPNVPAGMTPQQILDASVHGALGVSLTGAESQALTALAAWENVANVTFVSAADSNSVPVRFGANEQLAYGSASYSYLPPPGSDPSSTATGEAGDVYVESEFLNPQSAYYSLMPIAYVHEIGHVLGLGGESGTSDPYDLLPGGTVGIGGGQDSGLYTVMSYDNPTAKSNIEVTTPQAFDIAVAQYLYGANPSYNPNPSHVWTFNPAGGAGNLIAGGGVNTISAAGTSAAAFIDLRQGHSSWLGSGPAPVTATSGVLSPNQLFIDYGTVVDTAIAGSGTSTIVCNDDNDVVVCGTGNDLIVVGPGQDTVYGNLGDDTVLFQSAMANYTIVKDGDGLFTVTANDPDYGGTDVLSNITNLEFTDQTISGLAPNLGNLTAVQIRAISAAEFGTFSTTDLDTLSSTAAAALTIAQVRALSTTQIAGLSDTILNALSATDLAALTLAQIDSLTVTQIEGLSPALIGNLPVVDVNALGATAFAVLSVTQIDGLTATQLGGLTAASFAALSSTDLSALTATQIPGLSAARVAALSTDTLNAMSTGDIAALSTIQARNLTATQLNSFSTTNLDALTTGAIGGLTATQLMGLTAATLISLTTAQIEALNRAQIAILSTTQVGGLSATQLGNLTATQLGGLTTADIVVLSTTQIAGLSPDQIGAFSSTQVAALSTTDIACLTADQLTGLSMAEVAGLTDSQLAALSPGKLMMLSANQIGMLSSAKIASLSTAQYNAILG